MLPAISDRRSRWPVPLFATVAFFASGLASAEEATAPSDAQKFCANIGDAASDARLAWQARTLNELKAEVQAQTDALEPSARSLRNW